MQRVPQQLLPPASYSSSVGEQDLRSTSVSMASSSLPPGAALAGSMHCSRSTTWHVPISGSGSGSGAGALYQSGGRPRQSAGARCSAQARARWDDMLAC